MRRLRDSHDVLNAIGVETWGMRGSGGSVNQGPELLGTPNGATKILGQKIIVRIRKMGVHIRG